MDGILIEPHTLMAFPRRRGVFDRLSFPKHTTTKDGRSSLDFFRCTTVGELPGATDPSDKSYRPVEDVSWDIGRFGGLVLGQRLYANGLAIYGRRALALSFDPKYDSEREAFCALYDHGHVDWRIGMDSFLEFPAGQCMFTDQTKARSIEIDKQPFVIEQQEEFRVRLSVDHRYVGAEIPLLGVIHGVLLKCLRC